MRLATFTPIYFAMIQLCWAQSTFPEVEAPADQQFPPELYAKTEPVGPIGQPTSSRRKLLLCKTAGNGRLWAQASFDIQLQPAPREVSAAWCFIEFSRYQKIAPGLSEPKTACVYANIFSNTTPNDRGEIWCRVTARQIEWSGTRRQKK